MTRTIQIGAIAVLALLAACRDGADSADPADPGQLPEEDPPATSSICSTRQFKRTTTVDALPGGIWVGSVSDCANNVQYDGVTAMISEDGRFRILSLNGSLLAGVLQTTGDRFDGFGSDYARWGLQYLSGTTTDLYIQGLVTERQVLEGMWTTEWGFYGYFTFDYQQKYERALPLADLGGAWWSYEDYYGVRYDGVWTVEPDGSFSAQDNRGCLQSGQFSLIDARYNLVSVQLEVLGCESAGSYSGLAQLWDYADWGYTKVVEVSVDDGARALRFTLLL